MILEIVVVLTVVYLKALFWNRYFFIYINDMSNINRLFTILVDDTTIMWHDKNEDTVANKIILIK